MSKGYGSMGIEYGAKRARARAAAADRARAAVPSAGPVTVTRRDGTSETREPLSGYGVDKPGRRRL